MQRGLRSCCLLVLLVALIAPLSGQERFGEISGVVVDTTGAVLPGATVTVTNVGSSTALVLVTGPDGSFRAPALEPGRYSIRVELEGFAPRELLEVTVLVGRPLVIDSTLELGGVAEAISVTAEVPPIDIRGTTVANNLNSEEFNQLPKTRSFQRLALTAPKVNAGEIEGGFQVNGASGAENNFIIDGISTSSLINGSSRQNTVFEYVEEVQVKTAGIQADQYQGGALGGPVERLVDHARSPSRAATHSAVRLTTTTAATGWRRIPLSVSSSTRSTTSR